MLSRHGMGGVDVDIGHDHLGAGLGQAAGDGGAVAAAGAGDEGQASGEKVFQHAALIDPVSGTLIAGSHEDAATGAGALNKHAAVA
mgnify:CR=1 FL=1